MTHIAPARQRRIGDSLVVLVLGAAILLPGLGGYPLWDPDDSRHAEVAREMSEQGRWLVPVLQGEPYFDKPPVFYALVRIGYQVLGVGESAARLPSALATLATALLLHRFLLGRATRRTAALGALIFVTSPMVVGVGRFCSLDASLTFCITAAIVAGLRGLETPWSSREARRWFDVASVCMGLGTLVKGPVGLVLPAAILITAAFARDASWQTVRALRPLRAIGIVALVAAPVYGLAALQNPQYVATFLWEHNIRRYASATADHAGHGPFYFIPPLLGGMLPWSLLLPAALLGRREPGRVPRRLEFDLLLWAGVVVGFFSISSGKLASYVLPALPALSAWLAVCLTELGTPIPFARRLIDGATSAWFLVLLAAPIAAWIVVRNTWPGMESAALPLLLLWPVIGILTLPRVRRALEDLALRLGLPSGAAFARLGIVAVATAQIFFLDVAPGVSPALGDRDLAVAALARNPETPLIAYCIDASSLAFYSRRPVAQVCSTEGVRTLASRGPILLVTRPRHVASLTEAGVRLDRRLAGPRHSLYATEAGPHDSDPAPTPEIAP